MISTTVLTLRCASRYTFWFERRGTGVQYTGSKTPICPICRDLQPARRGHRRCESHPSKTNIPRTSSKALESKFQRLPCICSRQILHDGKAGLAGHNKEMDAMSSSSSTLGSRIRLRRAASNRPLGPRAQCARTRQRRLLDRRLHGTK